jgi:catechol 1,2-dioxygenase
MDRLVDEITYKVVSDSDAPTATAILGPFFRADTLARKNGDSLVTGVDDGEMTFMHGQVVDFTTKKPIAGATVEVWQASTNGLYEQQDPNQVEHNLRGKFTTDENGRYWFYCLRPTPYPVPGDGTFSCLIQCGYTKSINRSCWQAAGDDGPTSVPPCTHSHPGKIFGFAEINKN